jgi:hypothetical protein
MTFSEALEATKSLTLYEDRHATHTEFVLAAMAQQIEANRIAIEELRASLHVVDKRTVGMIRIGGR